MSVVHGQTVGRKSCANMDNPQNWILLQERVIEVNKMGRHKGRVLLTRVPLAGKSNKYKYSLCRKGNPSDVQKKEIQHRFEHHPHIAQKYIENAISWNFYIDRLWEVDSLIMLLELGLEPTQEIQPLLNKPAMNLTH